MYTLAREDATHTFIKPGLDRYLDVCAEEIGALFDANDRDAYAKSYERALWRSLKTEQEFAEFLEGIEPDPRIGEPDIHPPWNAERAAFLAAEFEAAAIDAERHALDDIDIHGSVDLAVEIARKQGIVVGSEAIAYTADRLQSKFERDAVYNPVAAAHAGILSYRFLKEQGGGEGGKVIYVDPRWWKRADAGLRQDGPAERGKLPVSDKFKLEWLGDIELDLNGQWLFKKLFPRTGVVSLYGDSRSFKTFLMIHAAYCAATGKDFAGRKVKNQGPVVYVAAEDGAGVKKRALGYHKTNAKGFGLPPRAEIPLAIVDVAPNLGTSPGDRRELTARIEQGLRDARLGPPSLIVIDTLNQSIGGEDENTTGMQSFMSNGTEIARHFQCCVVAVNHVGHAEKGRERGGSQIKGNAEGRIWVERPDEESVEVHGVKTYKTTLHVVKVKNGVDGFDLEATLQEIDLGQDEDGDEETTLAVVNLVELDERAAKAGEKPESKRAIMRREFRTAYHQLANDVAETPGLDGRVMVRKVKVDAVRDLLKKRGRLDVEDDGGMLTSRGRTAFRDAKLSLTETGGEFIEDDGLIWVLYPDRPRFAFRRKDKVES